MRIPDKFLQCLCYICTKIGEKWVVAGTVFFVGMPSESVHERIYSYAVTARHCLTAIEDAGGDAYLRVNTMDGLFQFIKIETDWFYPESEASDVAILPIAPWPPFEYKALPYSCLVNQEVIEREGIGIGDELYIAGLFTMRCGTKRNHPVVRSGVIASMANEQLEDLKTGQRYDAYLIEVRSIGGLSGSPVLVMVHQGRREEGAALTIKRSYYLLGLIKGHWDIKTQDVSPLFSSDLEQVNMGMAIVTPAHQIAEVLESDVLAKDRRRLDKEEAKKAAPTLD